MTFNNQVYDTLRWIAQYFLPALGTLYFTLASIWGFPYAEQIVGTLTALTALLGVLLGVSTANYKGDGTLIIDPTSMHMLIETPVEDFSERKSITLMVETVSSSDDTCVAP